VSLPQPALTVLRLSVFAGSFELKAAEQVCNGDVFRENLVDLLTALVDKSILIRTESAGGLRFRLLDTLRDYGREKIHEAGEHRQLRRRHLGWYRRLMADAAREWFSAQQVHWIARLEPESHNLREALDFALSESPGIALEMVGTLYLYAIARGFLGEMHHWLKRALTATPREPTLDRIHALYAAAMIAGLRGDRAAQAIWVAEAGSLGRQMTDSAALSLVSAARGFEALIRGDADQALACIEPAVDADDPAVRISAMMLVGWALESRGDIGRALIWQEKALAAAESAGEVVFRSYALWSIGVGWWRHGKTERAEQLLRECLGLTQLIDHPRNGAACLEALAWVARAKNDPRRAVVLMAAAQKLGNWIGVSPAVLPDLAVFHDECERRARLVLADDEFEAARRQGAAMGFDDAVAYALEGRC
jgi:serine/threonine-protein kinase PknK